MHLDAACTAEVTAEKTSTRKRKIKHEVHQETIESNNQTTKSVNKQSSLQMHNAKGKLNNRFKVLGIPLIFIIFYIASCELVRYGFIQLHKLSKDITLYRYHWMFFLMISCAGTVFTLLITAKISRMLCSTLEAIILVCVKYYYVAGGKQSFGWWQRKIAICLVIIYIIAVVCTFIAIESGRLISNNLDCASLSQDRLIVYRLSGLLTLVVSSIIFVYKISS